MRRIWSPNGYVPGSTLVLALTLVLPVLAALGAPRAVAQAQEAGPTRSGAYDVSLYDALEWRNIGPERGGRSIAVAGSASRPFEYYFGATGGGLWKTTDGGQDWEPVTDEALNSSSVGAVAVCEADPDVVYLGMGEVELRGNIMQGDGVYKSTDAGETWQHLGLEATQAIGRVRIDPNDCNRVFVAALGHPFGPNPERGIFRSLDGGQTWEKVLFVSDSTGAVDLSMDPNNPNVLYAGFWQVYRKPWMLSSGGAESGIFKSTDGGDTWTELTANPGLPEPPIGKIGVAVSPADPNRVYALIEARGGGVYRSDDGGASWEHVNEDRKLRQRAFYYTRIYADPQNADVVYALNTGFYKSVDGGETFPDSLRSRPPHGDQHDLWIAPNDPQRMINGNDGGANVSFDGGDTWTEQDFPTAQPYLVVTTEHFPYHVCGAQQDNSTVCVPSDGWEHLSARGPNHGYYYAVGGGESGHIAPHPQDLGVFYAGSYGGNLTEYDHRTGQERDIRVWPRNPMGHSAGDIPQRFQWTYPIVLSPQDPEVLYVASQHLWRSTNRGQSWEQISPDLTYADPMTLGPSGGPITKDQTSIEYYATIFAVAPSPHDPNVIWTGSDDGRVNVTRDGGGTWTDVTPDDLPKFSRVTMIEVSPHNAGTAYVAAGRYRMDDRAPYVFRTEDYGETWTKVVNGIAQGDYVWSVREDIVREGLLFAGAEHGVYVSWDNGANWQPLGLNLPDVQVPDLKVEDHDLVIATHGRSFWILDNIDVLRQLGPAVVDAGTHLFDPSVAYRRVDPGIAVYYSLNEPAEQVTLEFLEPDGDLIRRFAGEAEEDTTEQGAEEQGAEEEFDFGGDEPEVSVDAGMHELVWDLRYESFDTFPGMIMWSAGGRGPYAVPDDGYQVRLTVDGEVQTQSFEIRLDPRVEGVTVADLQEQFDFSIRIRDRVTEANQAVLLSRGIKQQIDQRIEAADDGAVAEAGQSFKSALTDVEAEIYQVRNESNQDPLNFPIKLNNEVAALLGVVQSADARPTDQSYEVFEVLSAELDTQLTRLNQVIEERLSDFNALLEENGLAPVERRPLQTEETTVATEG